MNAPILAAPVGRAAGVGNMVSRVLRVLHYMPVVLGLLVGTAHADTPIGGPVTADTTWTAAQGPYIVNADITVSNGAVLTIEPGTTVYMNAGVNLIVSDGALRAKATSAAPIVITSAADVQNGSPAPGNWGQLVFQDNTSGANTIIEWAQIRYGSGLRIEAASPTLNDVAIVNHAGPAISIDLKSSPAGTGLQASGNTLNGISVPAGEITDSINWRMQGIPYVVTQGQVSVGRKPVITGINPASVQVSMSVDAVISGTRLAGVESVTFDAPGVTATIGAGASDTAIPVRVTAGPSQPVGNVPFEVQTEAGRVRFDTGIAVIPLKPFIVVSSIAPTSLRRGESKSFQITGSHLQGAQISAAIGSGLTLSNLLTSESQATFTLAASTGAILGAQTLTISNPEIANNGTASVTVDPGLPQAFTNPTTLIIPPNNAARTFALRLSNADNVPHTLNLAMHDPTMATISPTSVTIPAGSTEVAISITGLKEGMTLLNVTSPTLASVSFQTFVTNALNGAAVGPVLAPAVGVDRQVPDGTPAGPIVAAPVGVDRQVPGGTSFGPVVAAPVGVDRQVPGGTSFGPIVASPVGVDRQILDGTSVGPIVSPSVGVVN